MNKFRTDSEKKEMAQAAIANLEDGGRTKDIAEKYEIHMSLLNKYIRYYKTGKYDEVPSDLMQTVSEELNGEPEKIEVLVHMDGNNTQFIQYVVDKPTGDFDEGMQSISDLVDAKIRWSIANQKIVK